ncbi:MAG: YdeI/OmpD-associated family protein, partial [Chloroflexota bacterium]
AFEARTPERTGTYSYENHPADLPPEYAARLRAENRAWTWWEAQTPSYRRAATWWVVSATQKSTRDRRLQQLIADCAAGRPIKPLTYERKTIAAL